MLTKIEPKPIRLGGIYLKKNKSVPRRNLVNNACNQMKNIFLNRDFPVSGDAQSVQQDPLNPCTFCSLEKSLFLKSFFQV